MTTENVITSVKAMVLCLVERHCCSCEAVLLYLGAYESQKHIVNSAALQGVGKTDKLDNSREFDLGRQAAEEIFQTDSTHNMHGLLQ